MTLPLFAIRPQPGLAETLAAGREVDLDVSGEPLFEIRPVEWAAPSDDSFHNLLLGSANAIRHGGSALDRWRGRDAYVVGEKTAQAAQAAGFTIAHTGSGGLQYLLDEMADMSCIARSHGAGDMKLLRLAGEKHVPLTPPEGITIKTCVVYRAEPLDVPESLAAQLREGGLVLLHSGEGARHFAAECDRLGIARARLQLAALAPRIAEAAGTGWGRVAAASAPCDGALLALAKDMCQ